LEPGTRRKYICLWSKHIRKRLGAMELRQITPLVLSEFILELQQDGVGTPTIWSCLGLLQSMFARAVEWDRTRVKLITKPRTRRARAIKLLRPVDVEALRRQMLASHKHGLRDATLVSVLAYAGLRPEEALALEYQHLRGSTILIEQKWVDGEIMPGQKTTRPPRFPPLLEVLRADIHDYELVCGRTDGLIFVDGTVPLGMTGTGVTGARVSGSQRARRSAWPRSPSQPSSRTVGANPSGLTTVPSPMTCATASRAC
jgi:integrase